MFHAEVRIPAGSPERPNRISWNSVCPAADVTNRCCSFTVRNHDRTQPEKGYFLCHAKDGKVRREFVAVEA